MHFGAEFGVRSHARQFARWNFDNIEFAGFVCGNSRCFTLDHLDNNFVGCRRVAAITVPIGVSHQRHLLILHPLGQLERAVAQDVLGAYPLGVFTKVLDGLARQRGISRVLRHLNEVTRRIIHCELKRVIIQRLYADAVRRSGDLVRIITDALDYVKHVNDTLGTGVTRHIGPRVAFDGPLKILGSNGRAVSPFQIFAQLKRPHSAVLIDRPRFGAVWLWHHVFVEVDKRAEQQLVYEDRVRAARTAWVHPSAWITVVRGHV